MLVKELMTKHATSIESSEALADAAELMRDHNVGILPVFEGGGLVGMLSDRDVVVRGIAEGKDPELTTVREIMTPRSVFVFEDQNIGEAAQMMRENRIRRLAVLDHDRNLVGIISSSDLPEVGAIEEQGASDVVNRAANIRPVEQAPTSGANASVGRNGR
jgi:CBS domain-containing protein